MFGFVFKLAWVRLSAHECRVHEPPGAWRGFGVLLYALPVLRGISMVINVLGQKSVAAKYVLNEATMEIFRVR